MINRNKEGRKASALSSADRAAVLHWTQIPLHISPCRTYLYLMLRVSPAVHNNGSSVGRIDSLDLLEEFQHAYGRERHPEVWPAGEVELSDQPRSPGTVGALLCSTDTQKVRAAQKYHRQQSFTCPSVWSQSSTTLSPAGEVTSDNLRDVLVILLSIPESNYRTRVAVCVFLARTSRELSPGRTLISFSWTLGCSAFRGSRM